MTDDKNSIILDVRSSEEFKAGYIPEAKQLDIRNPETFMQGLESLDKVGELLCLLSIWF